MPDFRNDRMTGFVNKEQVQTKQGKNKRKRNIAFVLVAAPSRCKPSNDYSMKLERGARGGVPSRCTPSNDKRSYFYPETARGRDMALCEASHIIGLPGGESITSKTSPYRLLLAPLLIPVCAFDYPWHHGARLQKSPSERQTLKERHKPRHKQRSTLSRGLCSHRLKAPQKERIICADTRCPYPVLQEGGSQANSTLLPQTVTKQQYEKGSVLKYPGNAKMLKTMQKNQVLTDKLYKKGEMLFICARCHTGATVFSAVREEERVRCHKTMLRKSDTKILAASVFWCKNADGKSHSSAKNSFEDKKSRLEQKQAGSIQQSEA